MKIKTINTIEISSLCDNSCVYCPAKAQRRYRKTGLMRFDIYHKSIQWVKHFCNQGTQRELNLFGIGEPTLHPQLVEFVKYARDQLPIIQVLHLNTNGNNFTRQLAKQLKDAGINEIDITAHKAQPAARTIRILQELHINHKISIDFVTVPNNWAGQVEWFRPLYYKLQHESNLCPWLSRGQIMIMSSGDLTPCCIDAFATGVFGTVDDDLTRLEFDSFELCENCHHLTPTEYEIMRK